jgi:hypothetical protein
MWVSFRHKFLAEVGQFGARNNGGLSGENHDEIRFDLLLLRN